MLLLCRLEYFGTINHVVEVCGIRWNLYICQTGLEVVKVDNSIFVWSPFPTLTGWDRILSTHVFDGFKWNRINHVKLVDSSEHAISQVHSLNSDEQVISSYEAIKWIILFDFEVVFGIKSNFGIEWTIIAHGCDCWFEVAIRDWNDSLLSAQSVALVNYHFHRIVWLVRNDFACHVLYSSINRYCASFVERVLLMTCKVKSLLIRPSDFLEYTFGFHFRSCLRRSHRSLCICRHYQVKNAWRRIIAGWHKLCFCEQIIHFIYVSFDCDLRLYRCIVLFVRKSEPASCCLEVYLISQFFACIFFQAFAWLADFEFLRQRVPRRVIWLEVFSHLW